MEEQPAEEMPQQAEAAAAEQQEAAAEEQQAETMAAEEPAGSAEAAEEVPGLAPDAATDTKVEAPAAGRHGDGAQEHEDPLSLPPHGTELFIGGVPRGATEDELRQFAEQAGEVFSVTLVKDPSNPANHRGYGFVKYLTREAALTALDRLAGKEMPGHPRSQVRVQQSQAKHKLFIGGIPREMQQAELEEALRGAVKGLQHVDMVMSKEQPELNRGFAFAEFYNSACAQLAKSVLSHPDFKLGDRQVSVEFAEPTQKEQAAQTTRTVWVGNLPEGTTEEKLREAFEKYGEIERANIPRPREGRAHSDFGFVNFKERVGALKAVEGAERPTIEGAELKVLYSKGSDPAQQQHDRGGYDRGGYDRGGYDRGGYDRGGYDRGGYDRGGYGREPSYGRGRGYAGGGRGGRGGRGGYGAPPHAEPAYGGGGYEGGGYGGEPAQAGPPLAAVPAATMGVVMPGAGGAVQALIPVQLPNGQIGYMLQPTAVAAAPAAQGYGEPGGYEAGAGPVRGYGRGGSGSGGDRRQRGYGGDPRYRPY